MAAGLMVGGFICREVSAFNGSDQVSAVEGLFYTATYIFTIPLYALILHLDYNLADTPPSLIPRIRPPLYFLLISIFTSAVITCTAQGCATYLSPEGRSPDDLASGLRLIKAALFLQLFLNLLLVIILKVWLIRLCIRRRQRAREMHGLPRDVGKVVAVLVFLLGLIILTNVFRTGQIYAKPTSRLWTNEGWFWGFVVAPLVLYSAAWHLMHPGQLISQRESGQRCYGPKSGEDGNHQTPAGKF
ncbi:uncharacterized protein Z520_09394 [Fonsecaea multimorphosa CBS 102226]|uniref:Uncharacterized protein n=1 Tax=Fonsecaea multimorphosa CBS 102226 TaxID=1442371 RepID=A0A0D2JW24_9EURO|nr:uncharacterized protein Z520_09394 [Fonsecaea multimorphosa CBS 102226]KIX94704.1 hypothetical protein Z520_09394 [Fonsecaea multimorphosa CBS 102226]OAL20479.1 hypothetical protein AYO22_08780 [Fonsecaea multimorphosa]